jgi:enamidase
MTRLVIRNIGTLLSGRLEQPVLNASSIACEEGRIAAVGVEAEEPRADIVVDAAGTTVAPGLIDSHCHVVLGDYTPRQKTVDFLASYVHGGITSVVSPGEIHAPGRPRDARGVVALAVAAKACFDNFHPGGMTVHAGAVVLEPTLTRAHFAELQMAGVRLAKFGFGAYADPLDGIAQVRWAQEHGIIVTCHSGGASIPGSQPITPAHLLALRPDVCGHINGGPTSLAEDGLRQVVEDSDMVLQLVQAGNVSSAVAILRLAAERGVLRRVVLGSDTPTGTGVMPLGVLKTVAELASLAPLDPAVVWALATGNSAAVWNLPAGRVEVGAAADLVVMDAPWGCVAETALDALARGDLPGISAVITGGEVRALRSRNTPAAARVASVSPPMPFLDAGH